MFSIFQFTLIMRGLLFLLCVILHFIRQFHVRNLTSPLLIVLRAKQYQLCPVRQFNRPGSKMNWCELGFLSFSFCISNSSSSWWNSRKDQKENTWRDHFHKSNIQSNIFAASIWVQVKVWQLGACRICWRKSWLHSCRALADIHAAVGMF